MLNLKPNQWAVLFDAMRADRIAKHFKLTAIDELIWRTLHYTFMNHTTGACWPSLSTLAKHAGCSRRTASTSIQRLRKAGWLRWQRRWIRLKRGRFSQAPNEYELKIPRRWIRSIQECKACARTTRLLIHIGTAHLMRPKKGVETPQKIQQTEPPPGFGSNSELLANIDDPELRASVARCLLIAAQG